jgi:hypothetical protein
LNYDDQVDDDRRRDACAAYVAATREYLRAVRSYIDNSQRWSEPLPAAESALADLDQATEALGRVEEFLIGGLAEQAERWLEEPGPRMTLRAAVAAVGVGGTVRRYVGRPVALSKEIFEFEVVRFDERTALLRSKRTLDERMVGFGWEDCADNQWTPIADQASGSTIG